MLKIMAITLAAAITRTVSLLLGIFIVECKLYFFQIGRESFSCRPESSALDGFLHRDAANLLNF